MNILINKIGIGTAQFGTNYGISNSEGKTSEEEVYKILEYSKSNSIRYIDTAFAYGNAEEVLGKFDLSKFRIISKYIPKDNFGVEYQIEKSLKRLNLSNIYGYLAHRPLDLIENNNKNWNILNQLKKNGLINKIGASFNEVKELEIFMKSNLKLDLIQVPYNYFDNRFEEYIKLLKIEGCEIHTRSAFLQGLFFCHPDKLSNFFDMVKPFLRKIQETENLSSQLLRYIMEKDFIDVVNIGVNNLYQLKENIQNIGSSDLKLPKLDFEIEKKILMPSEWPK